MEVISLPKSRTFRSFAPFSCHISRSFSTLELSWAWILGSVVQLRGGLFWSEGTPRNFEGGKQVVAVNVWKADKLVDGFSRKGYPWKSGIYQLLLKILDRLIGSGCWAKDAGSVTAGFRRGVDWKLGSSVTAQSTFCIVRLLIVLAVKAGIIARTGACLPSHFDQDKIQQ